MLPGWGHSASLHPGGPPMPTRSDPWPAGTPCWVDLGAPDVAASTAFYGAVLGWSFFDSGEEFGHYNICQVNGHAAAAIGPKQDPSQPTAWTVYLASDDTDATAAANRSERRHRAC